MKWWRPPSPAVFGAFLRAQGMQGLWGLSSQTSLLWGQAPPHDFV